MTMQTLQHYAYDNAPVPDNDRFPRAEPSLTLQATEKQDNKQDINPDNCYNIPVYSIC